MIAFFLKYHYFGLSLEEVLVILENGLVLAQNRFKIEKSLSLVITLCSNLKSCDESSCFQISL